MPSTVAVPRFVLVDSSKTSTVRPDSLSVPVSVIDPVSVSPSLDETPLSGEMARLVGAAGAEVNNTQVSDDVPVPRLPARSWTPAVRSP